MVSIFFYLSLLLLSLLSILSSSGTPHPFQRQAAVPSQAGKTAQTAAAAAAATTTVAATVAAVAAIAAAAAEEMIHTTKEETEKEINSRIRQFKGTGEETKRNEVKKQRRQKRQ